MSSGTNASFQPCLHSPSLRGGRGGEEAISSLGKLVSQKTSDNTLTDAYVLAHIRFSIAMSTFTLPKGGGGEGEVLPLRKVVSQNVSNSSYIALASIQISFTAIDIFGNATNTSLRPGEHLALKCCCCVK